MKDNSRGKTALVIGGGIAGISAACYLQKYGFKVTLIERHTHLGGRARVWKKDGFVFDMGPSWYWMPEIFEEFFSDFGSSRAEHYDLVRLDPSYRVVFSSDEIWDIPATPEEIGRLFESHEKGAGKKLAGFLEEGRVKYQAGMFDYTRRPSLSITEFFDARMLKEVFRLQMFSSFGKYVRKTFQDERIRKLVEFPVLFLGATAEKTPALYSMMTYADMSLGTWYPMGGMGKIVDAMVHVAQKLGVNIVTGKSVTSFRMDSRSRAIGSVVAGGVEYKADLVVGSGDYHHIETQILESQWRGYSDRYWESRVMAPSCLLFYLGLNITVPNLKHHTLFFDEDFGPHAASIYETHTWPDKPLLYVCSPSKSDPSVAPEGNENLFVLIPVAAGLSDTDIEKNRYREYALRKISQLAGINVADHILVERYFGVNDFKSEYSSLKGNAYGLANTLFQTAFLKPRIRSKKVRNLYYAGQLTVPGPGVPPSLISGKVVAALIRGGD